MGPKKGKREESMKKVPSVAPTMAIAPSDYEHIYHEGPAGKGGAADKAKSGREDKSKKEGRSMGKPVAAIPKLTAGGGLAKMPSNAPTMAIAPSDYEHIYHQGQDQPGKDGKSIKGSPKTPRPLPSPPATPPPARSPTLPGLPPPDEEVEGGAGAATGTGAGTGVYPAPARHLPPMPPLSPDQVLASPDGYTMLGRKPDPNNRGQALPPHIVRANNQFSRAVLQRVARFLSTKADPSYYS